jgi:hypothetical protein
MDELSQLMLEHEEFLEEALDCMEYGGELLTQAQVDCIRQACGKPNRWKKNPVLTEVFNDFANIFESDFKKFDEETKKMFRK